jgi:hypothetical protein
MKLVFPVIMTNKAQYQYPFSILYLPTQIQWILGTEKPVLNASFQDF